MNEKTDRNLQIVEDKKTMSWTQLVIKWGISYPALYRIVKRYKNKKP